MKTTSESIPDEARNGVLPPYSILIPIYHGEVASRLDECLGSVAKQTLPAAQVVVVEDGPVPEASDQVIERWRVTLPIERVRLPVHQGLGPALNAGLAACAHDIVGRMDADDVAIEHRFATQVRRLAKRPDLHVIGGQIEEFGSTSSRTIRTVPLDCGQVRAQALWRNPMNHMTVCYRRSVVLDIGGYRDVRGMEDYDLWVRGLAANLAFENVASVLVRVRTGPGFFDRRRGTGYARTEWSLGRTKVRVNLWPRWEVVVVTAARVLVRLVPAGLVALVYGRFLRSPA